MHRILLVAALWVSLAAHAVVPTTLRVVDLRWIQGQPELETWVGSLQGAVNRGDGDTAVFMITDETDAAWADALTATYRLNRETCSPGALLDTYRGQLTGQVLYDPKLPWTRNLALSLAAAAPGLVIASDTDLGVPTVQDLRTGWADRRAAYAKAIEQLPAGTRAVMLAPEDGHLLADGIAARKLPALGLNPLNVEDAALLRRLLAKLTADAQVLGHPGGKDADVSAVARALSQLAGNRAVPYLPMRDASNLSCFARFPITRPLLQARDEMPRLEAAGTLALIYDYGESADGGAGTVDYAMLTLPGLLDALADTGAPIGVEVPTALYDAAPALYQLLLAKVRQSAVELIAAPGADPARARQMDLLAASVCGEDDAWPSQAAITTAVGAGWHGLLVKPVARQDLPAWATPGVLPETVPVLLASRVRGVAELRAALEVLKGANQVIYLDPDGVPPAELAALLPEIGRSHTLVTPSQLFRGKREYDAMLAAIELAKAANRQFSRRPPTLRVGPPRAAAEVADDAALRVTVPIAGAVPVLIARLLYRTPDGRAGAADLRRDGAEWSATLPPMLSPGTLLIRARVVETDGLGESITTPTVVKVTGADADGDGLSDTLESYLGSDLANPDSDGDGLPDGDDDYPTRFDRPTPAYLAPLTPPSDRSLIVSAQAGTVEDGRRVIPAGAAVTWRLPSDSLPGAGVTLSLRAQGAGTVRLDDAAPVPLAAFHDQVTRTEISVPAALLADGTLRVEVTAGAAPVRVAELALQANPDGPYLFAPELTPAYPPAGVPIKVAVTAFSPHGVKTVTLKYGTSLGTMKSVTLAPVPDGHGVRFAGELPAHFSGTQLVYGAEAVDQDGRTAATPFSVVPIGRTNAHTVALLGGRDLAGTWNPRGIWDGWGRASDKGSAEDKHLFLTRPGKYTVWVLAQPRERGVNVRVFQTELLARRAEEFLNRTVPAGSDDGWYRLGTFTMTDNARLYVTVQPVGEAGDCAYGEVVLTQDDRFVPPLRHGVLDWYNSVTIVGVLPGEVLTGKKTLILRGTGNIDAFTVVARQVSGPVRNHEDVPLSQQADGTYMLQTRNLLPGEYDLIATGWRVVTEANRTKRTDELVTASVRVVVQGN